MSSFDRPGFASHHQYGHPPGPQNGNGQQYLPPAHLSMHLNPSAGQFHPSQGSSIPSKISNGTNGARVQPRQVGHQASQPSLRDFEETVSDLIKEQTALRTDVEDLKKMYNNLHTSTEQLKNGGWSVNVGPFRSQPAKDFEKKLDQLTQEVKAVDTTKGTASSGTLPPHLRGKPVEGGQKLLPPHMRKGDINESENNNSVKNPLATDGPVDSPTIYRQVPEPELTPPMGSPTTTFTPDIPIETIENGTSVSKDWMPHYIRSLPGLSPSVASTIPITNNMQTFSADFIRNQLDGMLWSPGMYFIPPTPQNSTCMLPDRTYYTLDPKNEPYLPKHPGQHGAKLTAFFNGNPDDEFYNRLDAEINPYENVPMFILMKDTTNRDRYVYFGHYSQTRWSDKLSYDEITSVVPHHVKQYWAAELSAAGRPAWVTNQLMKHFFPKPEYEGRMPDDLAEGSVSNDDETKQEEHVLRDVKKYVQALKSWEKDARLKTQLIKKEFVLQAFERADADDPPALRLWWEYLQCVDWKTDFYDLMVTLQSRTAAYE
ncbi:hypothetical protein BDV95DRAFT_589974 [Massariosphaeria phaeospora]|uniref:DUF6697 domain-containing protein n=1 Tax=Massariosphaeria phaeospora TaxID=100035 RepID=A0A7C8MFS8_9PLEO|nr:hypothetical protein BDV95DRAFT_589974 [Massariosphaeria phaeospora]